MGVKGGCPGSSGSLLEKWVEKWVSKSASKSAFQIRHVRRISGHPGKVGGKVGVHIRIHIRTTGASTSGPHPGDRSHPSHPPPVRFPPDTARPPAWPAGKSGANNSTMVMSAREKPRRGRISNLLVVEIQSNAFPA